MRRQKTFEDVLRGADPEVRRELIQLCVAFCQSCDIPPEEAQLNVRPIAKGVRYFYSRVSEPGANKPKRLVPKPGVHIFGADVEN